MVHGVLDVHVIDAERDPVTGKAFLRVRTPNGTTLDLTLNVAITIGGIAKGAAERLGYEPR